MELVFPQHGLVSLGADEARAVHKGKRAQAIALVLSSCPGGSQDHDIEEVVVVNADGSVLLTLLAEVPDEEIEFVLRKVEDLYSCRLLGLLLNSPDIGDGRRGRLCREKEARRQRLGGVASDNLLAISSAFERGKVVIVGLVLAACCALLLFTTVPWLIVMLSTVVMSTVTLRDPASFSLIIFGTLLSLSSLLISPSALHSVLVPHVCLFIFVPLELGGARN